MQLFQRISSLSVLLYLMFMGCTPANRIKSSWINKNHTQEKSTIKYLLLPLLQIHMSEPILRRK